MDIVQYLHGLVSTSLGIQNEDVRADLLRQYYALSAARLVSLNTPSASKILDIQELWGDQTAPLIHKLARSFHIDEAQVLTLTQSATPLMMSELQSLAGADKLSMVIGEHFERSRMHLPAWSGLFVVDPATIEQTTNTVISPNPTIIEPSTIDNDPNIALGADDINAFLTDIQQGQNSTTSMTDAAINHHPPKINLPDSSFEHTDISNDDLQNSGTDTASIASAFADDESEEVEVLFVDDMPIYQDNELNNNGEYDDEIDDEYNHDDTEDALASHRSLIRPTTRHPSPLIMGAIAGVVALAIGGGIWHFSKKKSEPIYDPSVATPDVQSLNPPRINITTGEHGTLYACRAEVGNTALQTELLRILQQNFGSVDCVMDIKDDYGTSLVGLERLESIIAMMKSDPFTSIEIIGNDIFLNSPNSDVLNRIVNDISLLAPQFKVSPFPALDRARAIDDGIDKATTALNALTYPPNSDDLARAMSLQLIDFNGTSQLPAQNHAVLALAAQKLIESPDTRLIIATHTNTGSDRAANISLSTAQATAIRDFLISQGVSDTQLVIKGVGDALPVADNVTELGQFKNRRTEFFVYDDVTMNALSVDMNSPIPTNDIPMMVENTPVYQYQTMPQGMPYTPQGMPAPIGYDQPLPVNPTAAPPMPQYIPQAAPQVTPQTMTSPVQSSPPLPNIEYVEVPSEPQIGFITNGQDTIITAPSTAEIPDDIRELSRPIHREGNRGQSTEIRE